MYRKYKDPNVQDSGKNTILKEEKNFSLKFFPKISANILKCLF